MDFEDKYTTNIRQNVEVQPHGTSNVASAKVNGNRRFWKLDIDPKEIVDLCDPQILDAVNKLEFPENVTRSPFMELTKACPDDQALAYQHAVMKKLAKRAYKMDHSFKMPQSTLLVNVVKPETEPYQCGVGWPFQDVKVAKAFTDQYFRADLRQRT
eukprot:367117-Amphidinium_carterae.1